MGREAQSGHSRGESRLPGKSVPIGPRKRGSGLSPGEAGQKAAGGRGHPLGPHGGPACGPQGADSGRDVRFRPTPTLAESPLRPPKPQAADSP